MPRKPTPLTPPADVPEPNHAVIEADSAAMTEVGLHERLQDSSLEVGKIVGRIESALFLTSVSEKVIAESFIQLRDGKKYKDLLISGADGNLTNVSDLEEACELLFGKTYRTCLRIAQKYESLGPELFESAERLGLRRKDYQALQALPPDDQALIKTTIAEATDRDSVTDLIGELTERHAKKLAEKDRVIADLGQKVELKERRIQVLGEERDGLKEKLIGMTLTEDATRKVALEKRNRALGALRDASLAMLGYVSRFDQAVADVMSLGDATAATEATDTLRATYQRLADLANAHGMPVDFAEVVMPPWLADLAPTPAAEEEEF